MTRFDTIVVVDWSASSTPCTGADSIWSCVLAVDADVDVLVNHPTRAAARTHLAQVLAATPGRVLVGFDLAFGYPQGTAAAFGLRGDTPWQAMWHHLVTHLTDRDDNRNDRFAVASALNARAGAGPGPFWGAPPSAATEHLSPRRAPGFPHAHPGGTLPEHRRAEVALRAATGRRPFPVWQLLGAGSVGSQTLTGIPVVHALRHAPALAHRSTVWPFESGLTVPDGDDRIVHAEVWPSAIDVDRTVHPVKDAAQVRCLARHLAGLDATGELDRQFAPVLAPDHERAVVTEEGWVLGATLVA